MGKKKGKKKPSQAAAATQEDEGAASKSEVPKQIPSEVKDKPKEKPKPMPQEEPQPQRPTAEAVQPKPVLNVPPEQPVVIPEARGPPVSDAGRGRGRGRGRGKEPQSTSPPTVVLPKGRKQQGIQPVPALELSFGDLDISSPVEGVRPDRGFTPPQEVVATPAHQGARPRPIHGQQAAVPQQFPQAAVPPHQQQQRAAQPQQIPQTGLPPQQQRAAQPQQIPQSGPPPRQQKQRAAQPQQIPQTGPPPHQQQQRAAQPQQIPQTGPPPQQQPQRAPQPQQTVPQQPQRKPDTVKQTGPPPQQTKAPTPSQPAPVKRTSPQKASGEPQLYPPVRKDYGKAGKPIRLRANHLAVKFDTSAVIHHYDVDIAPDLKNMKGLKRDIVETTIKQFPKQFPRRCVFDGEKNLYTMIRLPFPSDIQTFETKLPSNKPEGKPRIFQVAIKIAAHINLSDLQNFLDQKTRHPPLNAIQALDIVLRHLPTMTHISLGRSIFPDQKGPDIGGGVQMWTGYYQSLRPMWKTLHLNLDVSHRTFYRSQPVMDYACEILQFRNYDELMKEARPGDWDMIAKELKGLKIEVTHTYPVKRSYRIIGMSKKSAEFQTFPLQLENGQTQHCTVAKYFLDQYKKRLQYAKLPCLQAQPADKHRYLPMEFCMIPVGQQCKKLKDYQTADMIKKTAKPAPEREQKIRDLINTTQFSLDPYAQDFGLRVSESLTQLNGRILPPPGITLKQREKDSQVTPNRGVWDMRQSQFFKAVSVTKWGIFNYCDQRRMRNDAVTNFIQRLMDAGRRVGSSFAEPQFNEFMRTDGRDIEESIRLAKQRFSGLELIVCILPGKTPLYAEVKRVADTLVGIQTQCIQQKNVVKADPATLTNLMMKINAKLNGTNSILGLGRSLIFKDPVIILGADVTHPPAGDRSKPSIAAIVASMDQNAQLYKAKVVVQEHRVEIISKLQEKVKELLLEFHRLVKAKPQRIIFYRDGVGEGQFYEVLRSELIAIRAACASLSPEYKPAVTFLVVQKRHHTRLFCENPREADGRAQNVPPGTTVDTVITHPIENDFYLCSHQGIQGTSRPTHYHVLWDESELSADVLQLLTYQLCHTYVRCTRSVSIPAPAYYAHLVAFRARYHLEKLQKSLDQEGADPESYIERMQRAVEAHESLGKMYYV